MKIGAGKKKQEIFAQASGYPSLSLSIRCMQGSEPYRVLPPDRGTEGAGAYGRERYGCSRSRMPRL
jgi:hypothetical protein